MTITMTLSQHSDGTNVAEAIWKGSTFRAETHGGATHEVARQLVQAGIEDQPWQAVRGEMVCLSGKSIHRWAGLKTEEDGYRLRVRRWDPVRWQKTTPPQQVALAA